MNKGELSRRYLLFLCAVFINAFSIALITKAMLGTSPISSVPFVLSLFTPWSMGLHTIFFNFLFIILEMLMMKRNEIREKKYELLLQVPITICFGLFIDLSMYALGWVHPEHYVVQVLTLLLGCFILGLGISFEVKADVAMVTGEYLVQVMSRFFHREFGLVKVCFDVTLVIMACILSLLFLPGLEGVREGTVVAALSVGRTLFETLHACLRQVVAGETPSRRFSTKGRREVSARYYDCPGVRQRRTAVGADVGQRVGYKILRQGAHYVGRTGEPPAGVLRFAARTVRVVELPVAADHAGL